MQTRDDENINLIYEGKLDRFDELLEALRKTCEYSRKQYEEVIKEIRSDKIRENI
jgi:hypothetical protein